MTKSLRILLSLCLILLAHPLTTQLKLEAQGGIIIPEPPICPRPCPNLPPPVNEVPPLAVQSQTIKVTVNHQVATTFVEQVFRNDTTWSLEGTYIFPLPPGAAVSNFTLQIDGQDVDGELLPKDEARQIYNEIVRRRIDPALLEYLERDLFQASIFPIEPGQARRVTLEYNQILAADSGLVQYIFPLPKDTLIEKIALNLDIQSNQALKAIYSPSHPVSIDRPNNFQASIGWKAQHFQSSGDFALYYTLSPEDLGLSLLSYKPDQTEGGFFTMLIAPNIEVDETKVIEKDVVLIFDTSGSMEGQKLAQAKDALNFVLDHLNPGDRFNLIEFNTRIQAFAPEIQSTDAVPEAKNFVQQLRAAGNTDINRALLEGINLFPRSDARPAIIIFLTDGLPTNGVTDPDLILHNVVQTAPKHVRIFPFGVGDDVDTILLDQLAQEQRGLSSYVRPGERVDEIVSGFYAKIRTPVLADLDLQIEGVTIYDTYPYPLPDVFAGQQLIVVGRYDGSDPARVALTGKVNGEEQQFRYEDFIFANQGGQNFIPRLWATRKIGYLLNQIRLSGETPEAIEQIVSLSVRYGIITPYTAFLVEEPEDALTEAGRERIAADQSATDEEEAAEEDRSGSAAVSRSVESQALANADAAASLATQTATPFPTGTHMPMSQRPNIGGAGKIGAVAEELNTASSESQAPLITTVADKAFVLRDGVWTDTAFDIEQMTVTSVPFASEAFFDLLADYPEAAKYFALGEQVIVVLDGQTYQSTSSDIDSEILETVKIADATPTPTKVLEGAKSKTPPSEADDVSNLGLRELIILGVMFLLGGFWLFKGVG